MEKFSKIVPESENQELILHGNRAFALGVIHAGYHAADGYPGTPSTEMTEALIEVPENITAGWSVNEAVAVGVAVGHAAAGRDAVVSMKVPGVFQGGDVIASAAFSKIMTGALVLYVATDHEPSSTQYIIDSRDFLSSLKVPIIEPRNHQDLYDSAAIAADISRAYETPVVVLVSAILAHSQGTVNTGEFRTVEPREGFDGTDGVALPSFARRTFDNAIHHRIPALREWAETTTLTHFEKGSESWGVICAGEASMIASETIRCLGLNPSILHLGVTNPISKDQIQSFIETFDGHCYLIEDGERFVEKELAFLGFQVIGKEAFPTITNWTPEKVVNFLRHYNLTDLKSEHITPNIAPVDRPAAICPGCPYRAFSLVIEKFKKRGKLDMVMGDIGCSTLLHTFGALDLNFCMGASESIRQGYVLSAPEKKGKVISLIGDSSECHSGMDASRNGQFRKIGGVKVILDNSSVAMTGCQDSPTSDEEEGVDLVAALKAEGLQALQVDSYDMKSIERALDHALQMAERDVMSALVLKAPCLFVVEKEDQKRTPIAVDTDICIKCKKCDVCSSVVFNEDGFPRICSSCTRCGVGDELCMSLCPVGAIGEVKEPVQAKAVSNSEITLETRECEVEIPAIPEHKDSLHIAMCGVGGQGVLFMSKVLSEIVEENGIYPGKILAGEVHGMAQKGGSVYASFSCGNISSPLLALGSADVAVALEYSEIMQPGFLDLLKPGGVVILNSYSLVPRHLSKEDFPTIEEIRDQLKEYTVISMDLSGDIGKMANTAALGMLSVLPQFDDLKPSAWRTALDKLSPNERIADANLGAFTMGREAMESELLGKIEG